MNCLSLCSLYPLSIVMVREFLGGGRLDNPDDHPDESDNKELELPQFDLSVIVKATDDFSFSNKLGEGGFGPVYKVKSYITNLLFQDTSLWYLPDSQSKQYEMYLYHVNHETNLTRMK